ncbi:TIGR02391 family protein [Pseudactinotalea sp.]|uniref:TIGR02391 family protein n=1 Tax=Pseudactinotalea sp. TaxID=1926260 RepID=UPI003B3B8896
MDEEWALEQLGKWLTLHERVPLPAGQVRHNRKTRPRGSVEERSAINNVAWEISRVLYVEPFRSRNYIGEDEIRRMMWEITDGVEVRSRLGQQTLAPRIAADSMHPWVWHAAEPHWTSGNHGAAIWAAAINLNSRIQQKVGRKDVGEGKLLQEVFSVEDPKPGKPRLRRVGAENLDLFNDMHVGPMNFGKGLFAAVRNPLNHVTADEHQMGEAESLEALAALSLLARWVDEAEVVESA